MPGGRTKGEKEGGEKIGRRAIRQAKTTVPGAQGDPGLSLAAISRPPSPAPYRWACSVSGGPAASRGSCAALWQAPVIAQAGRGLWDQRGPLARARRTIRYRPRGGRRAAAAVGLPVNPSSPRGQGSLGPPPYSTSTPNTQQVSPAAVPCKQKTRRAAGFGREFKLRRARPHRELASCRSQRSSWPSRPSRPMGW